MISFSPYAVPEDWLLELTSCSQDYINYWVKHCSRKISMYNIADILHFSLDADDVMSAINMFYYYMKKRQYPMMEFTKMLKFESERWVELINLRQDIANECIKLFSFIEYPPAVIVLEAIQSVACDLDIDKLVDVWVSKQWKLSITLIETIRTSSASWKLLHLACPKLKDSWTTFEVLDYLFNALPHQTGEDVHLYSLLKHSTSVLKYIIQLDVKNKKGMKSTFEAINGFDAWQLVLCNAAAVPIIDYSLEYFFEVRYGEFTSRESLRKWIVRNFSECAYIGKYATEKDIESKNVSIYFYKNPSVLKLIAKWLETNPITATIMNGIVNIAASNCKETAMQGLEAIENGFNTVNITRLMTKIHWLTLVESKFGFEFTCKKLKELDEEVLLCEIMRMANLVPVVQFHRDEVDLTESIHLFGLNLKTVHNMQYDSLLCQIIANSTSLLSYDVWICLFGTEFGIKLGLDNVDDVMDAGALFALLESPFLSTAQIINLYKNTDVFEYCADDEFMSLTNRKDAYRIDLSLVSKHKKTISDEIIAYWHEPMRLIRMSNNIGVSLREYLQYY